LRKSEGERRLLKRFRSEVCLPIYDVAVSGLRSCWERCSCGCYCTVFVVLMVLLVIMLEIGDISIIIFLTDCKVNLSQLLCAEYTIYVECGRCLILSVLGDCFGPCSDEIFLERFFIYIITNFEL